MSRKTKTIIRMIILAGFVFSLGAFIYSNVKKTSLPPRSEILQNTYKPPIQKEIDQEPFIITSDNSSYNIIPKYSYELWGLIVTSYDTDIWYDITHENDSLNTKDICVIWGTNIETGVYKQMKFRSGEFTCFAEFKSGADSSWYEKFDNESLSNNHLLPSSEELADLIRTADPGDQIHLKGLLVDYSINSSNGQTGVRDTSTVRTDYGCEIIYTTDFEITRRGNEIYHTINSVSKYLLFTLILSQLILLFIQSKRNIPSRMNKDA